jgi:predicted ATP-grasp superfamily ATP-dependent carboligase
VTSQENNAIFVLALAGGGLLGVVITWLIYFISKRFIKPTGEKTSLGHPRG